VKSEKTEAEQLNAVRKHHKKKTMKTKQQTKQEKTNGGSPNLGSAPELQSRSEQLSGNNNQTEKAPENNLTTTATEAAPQGGRPGTDSERPHVNFAERDHNRQLPVEKVLAILKRWMPRQYELAEVVGKWIWITFPEPPTATVRAELSQLGFHWNNTRKCWQHPCGQTLPRGQQEPREKYGSFMASAARTPADQAAA
jgi:hypothetical protein